jgi:hypothetical protein
MILYHGSNLAVMQIDFRQCRPYRDFGTGFYMTPYLDQAKRMSKRVARIYGGQEIVSAYSFKQDEAAALNMLVFESPDTAWANFVMNNRSRSFNENESPDCNHDAKYDIVIGPVADDDMALLFRQYAEKLITREMLAQGMTFRHVNSQYSFHTERALETLSFKEIIK